MRFTAEEILFLGQISESRGGLFKAGITLPPTPPPPFRSTPHLSTLSPLPTLLLLTMTVGQSRNSQYSNPTPFSSTDFLAFLKTLALTPIVVSLSADGTQLIIETSPVYLPLDTPCSP